MASETVPSTITLVVSKHAATSQIVGRIIKRDYPANPKSGKKAYTVEGAVIGMWTSEDGQPEAIVETRSGRVRRVPLFGSTLHPRQDGSPPPRRGRKSGNDDF